MMRITFAYKNLSLSSLPHFLRTKQVKIVLFGNTHGYVDDIGAQRKIIEAIKPSVFLYELAENRNFESSFALRAALRRQNDENFSIISTYGELKPVIQLCLDYGLPLIGMDLKNIGRRTPVMLRRLSPREREFEKRLTVRRETHQAAILRRYADMKCGTIFASTGAYHLRKTSVLLKLIGQEALVVYPGVNGRLLLGPQRALDSDGIRFYGTLLSQFR